MQSVTRPAGNCPELDRLRVPEERAEGNRRNKKGAAGVGAAPTAHVPRTGPVLNELVSRSFRLIKRN